MKKVNVSTHHRIGTLHSCSTFTLTQRINLHCSRRPRVASCSSLGRCRKCHSRWTLLCCCFARQVFGLFLPCVGATSGLANFQSFMQAMTKAVDAVRCDLGVTYQTAPLNDMRHFIRKQTGLLAHHCGPPHSALSTWASGGGHAAPARAPMLCDAPTHRLGRQAAVGLGQRAQGLGLGRQPLPDVCAADAPGPIAAGRAGQVHARGVVQAHDVLPARGQWHWSAVRDLSILTVAAALRSWVTRCTGSVSSRHMRVRHPHRGAARGVPPRNAGAGLGFCLHCGMEAASRACIMTMLVRDTEAKAARIRSQAMSAPSEPR